MWGAESIPSKMPLRNVEDFEGVKMRAPEGMGAAIWGKLGVGVSTLPGTEVYTALERGNIEATDWGTLGMNDELGYGDIAPYAIYPGHPLDAGQRHRDQPRDLERPARRPQAGAAGGRDRSSTRTASRPTRSSTRASPPSATPRP